MIALLVHTILWFVVWQYLVSRNSSATPKLTIRTDDVERWPAVSVLVPARNEERAIEKAIRSLLQQDYPGTFNVVCANDHSTDKTGRILRRLAEKNSRLLTFDTPDLPPGWMGKCHALHCAVERNPVDAEIYLFTDADCMHRRDGVRRAVAHMLREKADLLAIAPHVECEGFWENVTLPTLLHQGIAMLNPGNLNDPEKKEIAGIGAFTMLRRDMYDRWGGHRAIRGEVIDDMAIGMMTKKHGGRMLLVWANRVVWLRMYTDLQSIVNGFEKNMHTAVGGHFVVTCLAAIGLVLLHTVPLMMAVISLFVSSYGLPVLVLSLFLHVAIGWAIHFRTGRLMTTKGWQVVFFYPLGAILGAAIMVRSAYHAKFHGEVRWRGRRLPLPKQETKMF